MPSFGEWLQAVRTDALARGIKPSTLDIALIGLEPVPVVLERDRQQAEFTLDLSAYLRRRLTPDTLRTRTPAGEEKASLTQRVAAAYGVEPRVQVAVWGLESNFGRFSGVRPVIPSLATLAYDDRRRGLFRGELLDALTILDSGDMLHDELKGSWAGAMGQTQFLPSSYLAWAVDFDNDGRRNIWSSEPDVFASIANYLRGHGWVKGVPVGIRRDGAGSCDGRVADSAAPSERLPCRPRSQRASIAEGMEERSASRRARRHAGPLIHAPGVAPPHRQQGVARHRQLRGASRIQLRAYLCAECGNACRPTCDPLRHCPRGWPLRCATAIALCSTAPVAWTQAPATFRMVPDSAFRTLFNGRDLRGWHGRGHVDPRSIWALDAVGRARAREQSLPEFQKHWRVENGELVNDGDGPYATTDEEFGDIELRIEYRTVAKADSGIYLRGNPQVQIWDTTEAGGKWDRGAQSDRAACSTSAPARPAATRWCWPTSRSASGIGSASSRSASGRGSGSTASSSSMARAWRTTGTARSRCGRAARSSCRRTAARSAGAICGPRDSGRRGHGDARRARRDRVRARLQRQGLDRLAGTTDQYSMVDGAIVCKPDKGGTIYTSSRVRRLRRAPGVQAAAGREQRAGDPLPRRGRHRVRRHVRAAGARQRRRRSTRSSTRGSTTARSTAWWRRTAATCGRRASGTSRR